MKMTGVDAPELEDSRPEHSPLDNEIDPMRDESIGDPEEYMLAVAELGPVGASGVTGELRFKQRDELLEIGGRVSGLAPGSHGLHVHQVGDCSGPVGEHFSPAGDPHGSPQEPDAGHHAGDLGNITADDDGNADIELIDAELELGGTSHSIIGRAVIVHAGADDLTTQPAGNSGAAVACGIIRPEPRPAYVPD